MPIAQAQGRKFDFPEGTTPEQMGVAIDEFFSSQEAVAQPAAVEQPKLTGRQQRGRQVTRQKVEEERLEQETSANLQALQSGEITAKDLTPEQIEAVQQQRVAQLPELGETGVQKLAGTEGIEGLGTAAIALTTLDPQELGQVLSTQFPQIGVVSRKDGTQIAVNNETGATVVINRPGISSTDILQGLGLVAAFTPAAKLATAAPAAASQLIGRPVASKLGVSALAQAGGAAGTETAIQSIQEAAGGEFNTEEVALAGALAGGFDVAIPAARNLLQQARQLRAQGVETAEEATRRGLIESRGFQPTRPQVTQRPEDFQLQQELQKGGGAVREVLDVQEQRFAEAFEQQARDTGGNVVTSGSTPIDEVVGRSVSLDQRIGELYTQARAAAPTAENITTSRLVETLSKSKGFETKSGGVVSAARSILKDKGIELAKPKTVAEARSRDISVETAEDIRQQLNQLFPDANPTGKNIIRKLKDSLDKDVFKEAGEDLFSQARSAKASFEEGLNRAKVSKFDTRKNNLVRDVLENKINPDTFINDVIFSKKWRSDDIGQLKSYLNQTPSGKQAFDDIKAQTIDSIKNKMFTDRGELKNAALGRELNKIGSEKLKAIFNKDELRFLRDMREIAKLRTPPRAEALGKGPSAQAISQVKAKFPIFGGIFDSFSDFKKSRLILRLPKQTREITALPEARSPGAPVQTIRQEQ